MVDEQEHRRRRAAYEASGKDAEAADALGLKLSTYVMWRRSQGLPAKRLQGHPDARHQITPIDRRARLEAYRNHPDDATAAAACGVSTNAFRRWRHANGLREKRRA